MNGPDAVREMRLCGYRGAVLGVTGAAEDEANQIFLAAGADAVIPKPVNLATFRNMLRCEFSGLSVLPLLV